MDETRDPDAPTSLAEIAAAWSVPDQALAALRRFLATQAATEPRYTTLELAGRGGVGEVYRVLDHHLERTVAMKVLRPEFARDPRARTRFWNEALLTASLGHPGIVPVHDRSDGQAERLWFTMKYVSGETFRARIAAVHMVSEPGCWGRTENGWSFRRLVEVLRRVCEAVAFAHGRNVVHRDLKPANVMIGPAGETLVMDWGLARRAGSGITSGPPTPAGVEADLHTREGEVLGTPAYMAPEQAAGHVSRIGPATDVYSIGGMLYELLTGRHPYSDSDLGALVTSRSRPPTPVTEMAGEAAARLPPPLVELCHHCLEPHPEDRPAHAGQIVDALMAWLDGELKGRQADEAVDRAVAVLPRIQAERRRARRLADNAGRVRAPLAAHSPVSEKRAVWALEDASESANRRARLLQLEYVETLRLALELAPDHRDARARLATLHRNAASDAITRGDHHDAAVQLELLKRYDDGQHTDFLEGRAHVTLWTDPPGAEVLALGLELRDRRLVSASEVMLGRTPLGAVELKAGSYVFHLRAQGRVAVRYPVYVDRGGHWHGVPPGAGASYAVPLPETASGQDECYVPAGWFTCGGDDHAIDGLALRRCWVDGFVARRHPTTNRAYVAFLNALSASGLDDEAARFAPQSTGGAGDRDPDLEFVLDGGRYQLRSLRTLDSDPLDWPVTLVDWFAATAFARWESTRTGLPWRLMHTIEWEKAARGVDGRRFPWGDHAESTWACVAKARPGAAGRAPVDAFPEDESVYGLRGMAGGVRTWCGSRYQLVWPEDVQAWLVETVDVPAADTFMDARGGAWGSSIEASRSAGRFAAYPLERHKSLGFRLCRDAL